MACGGMIFIEKFSNFRKTFHFVLFHLIFPCYYCSINVKRQSELSGLSPDTSSLVQFELKHLYFLNENENRQKLLVKNSNQAKINPE